MCVSNVYDYQNSLDPILEGDYTMMVLASEKAR